MTTLLHSSKLNLFIQSLQLHVFEFCVVPAGADVSTTSSCLCGYVVQPILYSRRIHHIKVATCCSFFAHCACLFTVIQLNSRVVFSVILFHMFTVSIITLVLYA